VNTIDLRSDTATRPTPEMLEAMMSATIGAYLPEDDAETVLLEEEGAEYLGQERSLFLPTATMGNLLSLLVHTHHGDAVVFPPDAHVLVAEASGYAELADVAPIISGSVSLDDLYDLLQNRRGPRVSLVWIENTHTRAGGTALSHGELAERASVAREAGCRLHVDGARLPNAAAASGARVRELATVADSVCLSLNKGLGAPIGALLAGEASFIDRAKVLRKRLGGDWRKPGHIAAAARVALRLDVGVLAQDHAAAKEIALVLEGLPRCRADAPATNIILANFDDPDAGKSFVNAMATRGVLASTRADNAVRMVTHYSVTDADVPRVLDAIRAEALEESSHGSLR
jgi:threonine aldolase